MMVEPSEVTDMDLYLMQHGHATTEAEDPERPLTDAGRAAVRITGIAHFARPGPLGIVRPMALHVVRPTTLSVVRPGALSAEHFLDKVA
jgi:hypothetical protein